MKILGLFHRIDGILAYQNTDGSLTAILKAPIGKIKEPIIYYDDSYSSLEKNDKNKINPYNYSEQPLSIESDEQFTYYKFKLNSHEKRFKYFFSFKHKQKTFYYGEQGLQLPEKIEWSNYHRFSFTWNYSSNGKYIGPKKWWNQTSWYQIFPDRFNNEGKKLVVDYKNYHSEAGGNLKGITKRLDYIKELGFNGIYLNPIFSATSSHKYDTKNYFEIDESFGSMQDFEDLINELKKRNMKIMLDGVFNHVGYEHPYWQDVIKHKEKSIYKDWFVIWDISKVDTPEKLAKTEFYKGTNKGFSTFANTPTMPRLNWQNPLVKDYIVKICLFWAKKGIDAWRMDVADEVAFDLWRVVKQALKEYNSEIMILGEIWYDSLIFLNGDQMDSTMNYPFRSNALEYFVKNKLSTKKFVEKIIENKYRYSQEINKGLFNLISSHDVPRILRLCNGNKVKTALLFSWLLLSQGSPSFYYGDEINLSGKDDHDNREIFDWNKIENKTIQLIKKLNDFRNENIESIEQGCQYSYDDATLHLHYSNNVTISISKKRKELSLNGEKFYLKNY